MEKSIDFDRVARWYDHYVGATHDLRFWKDEARRHPGLRLELMCGTGRFALALLEAGLPVTCVDYSAGQLANGDFGALVREAVKCALEKHGKRRGAVEPSRPRKSAAPAKTAVTPAPGQREPIPAAVRREVWKRDGGRCAWRAADGRRCGSAWKLELDHIVPVALGGRSDAANLRVCCRTHNELYAERVFGRAHMEQFRRDEDRRDPSTTAGGSSDGAGGEDAALTM